MQSAKIKRAIEEGFKVVVWPSYLEAKDINDMILKESLTPEAIQYIIKHNSYVGIRAQLALTEWSKQ